MSADLLFCYKIILHLCYLQVFHLLLTYPLE